MELFSSAHTLTMLRTTILSHLRYDSKGMQLYTQRMDSIHKDTSRTKYEHWIMCTI